MSSQDKRYAIAMSRDVQPWKSSFSLIQTYLQFPVLIIEIIRFILCT